jgi:hypothetical protein
MWTNINRQLSQASPCEICGGQSGTRSGFSTTISVFLSPYHPASALHSVSSTNCSYQMVNLMNTGSFPNGSVLSEIGEHWIEKNFHISLQKIKEIAGEYLN